MPGLDDVVEPARGIPRWKIILGGRHKMLGDAAWGRPAI